MVVLVQGGHVPTWSKVPNFGEWDQDEIDIKGVEFSNNVRYASHVFKKAKVCPK